MRERVAFLDGLRALAVLAVVGFHAVAHDAKLAAALPAPFLFVLRQGCHGVDLFFVLSGFCLSYPFLVRLKTAGAAKFYADEFAARRMLRIIPPYYAAIAVLLIAAFAMAAMHVPLPVGMPQHGFSAGDVMRQALFFDTNVRLLNDVFWSLAVEFRWYFVFPFVLWLWIRSPRAFGVLGVLAFCAATATRAQSVDLAVLPTFMLGIVAADLWIRQARGMRFVAPVAFIVGLTAAFLTAPTTVFTWSAGPLWGISMFWFVVTAACWPSVRRVLSLRALTLVGFTSYGIYLVHEPLRGALTYALQPHLNGWALWSLTVMAAIAGGMAFSAIAEVPFLRSRLKEQLLLQLRPPITRYIGFLGLGSALTLQRDTRTESPVRAVA